MLIIPATLPNLVQNGFALKCYKRKYIRMMLNLKNITNIDILNSIISSK